MKIHSALHAANEAGTPETTKSCAVQSQITGGHTDVTDRCVTEDGWGADYTYCICDEDDCNAAHGLNGVSLAATIVSVAAAVLAAKLV